MKNKGIIITVIALLSVWAVLATVEMIEGENKNRSLLSEHTFLESNYERLQEKYEAVKEECDELKANKNGNKYLGLAYEISFEALTEVLSKNEDFDIEQKINEVVEREKLNSYEKRAVCILAEEFIKRTSDLFK